MMNNILFWLDKTYDPPSSVTQLLLIKLKSCLLKTITDGNFPVNL